MGVLVFAVLERAVFGVFVLGVLVGVRMGRAVAVFVFVVVEDVLVRMGVTRAVSMLVVVDVFFACHGKLYSLYTD